MTLSPKIDPRPLLALLLVAAAFAVGGCGTTSAQRIAWASTAAREAATLSAELEEPLARLTDELDNARGELAAAAPDSIDAAKWQTRVDELAERVRNVAAKKAEADRVFAELDTKLVELRAKADATLADEVGAVAGGIKIVGSALPQPWNAIVGVLGSLLGVGATAWGKRERRQRKAAEVKKDVAERAVVEVVRGVETLKPDDPKQAADIDTALAARQSTETRELVEAAKTAVTTPRVVVSAPAEPAAE